MDTAQLQNKLTGALIGLARATEGNSHMLTDTTADVALEGLRVTGCTDTDRIHTLLQRVDEEKRRLVPSCYICASPCGRNNDYDMRTLQDAPEDIRALKLRILSDIRSIAAHTAQPNTDITNLLYLALFAIGMDDWGTEELLPIAEKAALTAAK